MAECEGGLMKPHQVADLFGVHPRTITRWAKAGRLDCVTTLGGHRRFRRADVDTLLKEWKASR